MKKDKFAYKALFNQHAFTLIESMFVLWIVVTIFLLFPLMIKTYAHIQRVLTPEETYEWNIFLIQFRKELGISKSYTIENNHIKLLVNNNFVSYEPYGALIRRRVNETGHEVVLRNVKDVKFTEVGHKLQLVVQFLNQTKEEAVLIPVESSDANERTEFK